MKVTNADKKKPIKEKVADKRFVADDFGKMVVTPKKKNASKKK